MKRLIWLILFALPFSLYSQGALIDPTEAAPNGPTVKQYNFSTFPSIQVVPDLEELASMTPEDQYSHPEYGQVPYRTQCKDCIELLDRRTEDSRYFVRSGTGGQTFYVQQIYGELHYEDANGWLRTIDPRVRPLGTDGMYGAPDQPVPTSYDHISGYSEIESPSGTLRYNGLTHLKSYNESGQSLDLGILNHQNMMVGEDGVKTIQAWQGIDRIQIFKEGAIKTNFILKAVPNLPSDSKWMVFEDRFDLPVGHQLVKDPYEGATTSEGWWMGDLVIQDAAGQERFRIRRAVMSDANPSKYGRVDLLDDPTATYIAYDYEQQGEEVVLSIRVNAEWLNHPGRVYPVTVDPLVSGSATFSAGVRGMRYDAACWNATNYCSMNLTVNVPGNSTLTNAFLDAQYNSEIFGCGIFLDCWMSEAAFRVVGPCGNSPPSPLYWTCLSPGGDAPGTCSGVANPAFQTVSCMAPQCPNYNLNFEMRSYYCFCSSTGCPTSCQFMPNNSWVMTVEARTIESSATANGTPITYNGSCSVPQTVTANPNFGVPAYSYNWNNGPTPTNPSQVVTHTSNGTFSYQCTVTDACGQTSITSVNVVISDCPFPVEIEYFTGEAEKQFNVLSWRTASESQLDRFALERSIDGESFIQLGDIPGEDLVSGSSYQYVDRWPPVGESHYRLKIIDKNGAVKYSEVIRLEREAPGEKLVISYVQDGSIIRLTWDGSGTEQGEILLYSVNGQELSRLSFQEELGRRMEVEISTSDLSAGTYFLRWKGQNQKIMVR